MKVKKILALLVSAVLLFVTLPLGAFTASAETYSGTCGENLTWTITDKVLTISGTGNMINYSEPTDSSLQFGAFGTGCAPWFTYEIDKVIIEDGVTSIGSFAFNGKDYEFENGFFACYCNNTPCYCDGWNTTCSNCFSDSWTETVYSNLNITEIIIPDSVEYIGMGAFYGCDSLESLTTPIANDRLGELFRPYNYDYEAGYMTSDTGVNECVPLSLKTVILSQKCKNISDSAFAGCTSIKNLVLPEGIENIGECAFYNCINANINLPDSVKSIGIGAFGGTTYCNNFNGIDDVLYIGNHLISCGIAISGAYSIKNGTKSIATSAFEYCNSLTAITIPDSITSIGNYAFYNCSSLISVTIPDSIKSIGDCSFYNCTSLSDVYYRGNEEIKTDIYIGSNNKYLNNAVWHYNSCINSEFHSYKNSCDSECNTCGNIRTTSHIYKTVITEPTCTTDGYTTYTCENCSNSYIDDEIFATGHSFSDWIVRTDMTCETDGEEYRTCSNCNTEELKTISAQGHTYMAITTPPTCTENGYTTYICSCGDSYVTDEINNTTITTAHITTNINVRAGASTSHDVICQVGYITATVLDFVNENENIWYKISFNLGDELIVGYIRYDEDTIKISTYGSDSDFSATGHNFGDWKIRTNADCETDGEKYRICSTCEHEETMTIPALGHSFAETFDIYKEANDFEEGLKFRICTNLCGTVTDETVIPKTSLADGICGEDAKWAVREDGTLVFAGNGSINDYKLPSYAPWSDYSNEITQIIIPETISKIGNNNFGNFTALSKIVIENPYCTFGLWVFPEDTNSFAIYCMGGSSVEEYTKNNNIILIKPECPNIPIAPILKHRTESSVELEKIEGYEYSIDGVNWQADSIFNNLFSGKSYTFYQRIAENIYAPSANSDSLTVTTLSKTQPPIIISVAKNIVTLQHESGYEYSIDGVNWQSSNIFSKVSYDTLICFYQRKAANGTDEATSASESTKCIIASAPKVLVGQSSIKVVAKSNYEYCIDDMVWQDSNIFTKYIIQAIIQAQKSIPQIQGFPWVCGIFLFVRLGQFLSVSNMVVTK